MKGPVEILADHYQKTYELTSDLWKERNRIFLALIALIGGSTILTFNPGAANSLLVLWAAKALGVPEAKQVEFGKSFPFGLVQTVLLIAIFYLMVNLYHRSLYIIRNYRYLGALEDEIRTELGSASKSVAFTREGSFYWRSHQGLQSAVKWCFVILVGLLLLAFMGGRIYEDLRLGKGVLILFDVLVSLPTALFFAAYAVASVSQDKRTGPPKNEQESIAQAKGA